MEDIMNAISSIIRTGTISSVNEVECKARVVFEDRDDIVSQDLYLLYRGTKRVKPYLIPEVGETALCLFLPNAIEEGYIIGSYYNDMEKPAENNKNIFSLTLPNGTKFKYDLSTNKLILEGLTSIDINAQEVNLNGNLKVSGDIFANNI